MSLPGEEPAHGDGCGSRSPPPEEEAIAQPSALSRDRTWAVFMLSAWRQCLTRIVTHAYGRARYPPEEEQDGGGGDPPGGVEVCCATSCKGSVHSALESDTVSPGYCNYPRARFCTTNRPGAVAATSFSPFLRHNHLNSPSNDFLSSSLHEYKIS